MPSSSEHVSGRLQTNYQQALLASLPGGVSGLSGTKDKIAAFKVEDPREEILKYAKLAEEVPGFDRTLAPAPRASSTTLSRCSSGL